LKASIASSTAGVCGGKRHAVTNIGKKETPWWYRKVKDAIRAKNLTYVALLQNKAESSVNLGELKSETSQP